MQIERKKLRIYNKNIKQKPVKICNMLHEKETQKQNKKEEIGEKK